MTQKNRPAPSAAKKIFPVIPAIFIVFALALAIRFIFLFQILQGPFTFLTIDCEYYDNWALGISQGDILGNEVFYGLPLYPYVLGLIYSLFGHNPFAARLVMAVLGAVGSLFLYKIGKSVFNKPTGITAALIFALYKPSIYHEGMLDSTALAIFLYLSGLAVLISILRKPSAIKWLMFGFLAGITCLANASIIVFILLMIPWAFTAIEGARRRATAANIAIMGIAFLSVLSVSTVRNYVVGHDFVPVTSHAGITFYAGNNPESNGTFKLPDFPARDIPMIKIQSKLIAEEALARKLKPSEVSRFWFGQGLLFIAREPLNAMKLLLKKIYLFFWVRDINEIMSAQFLKKFTSVLGLPLFGRAFVAPLSLVGIFLSFRKRRSEVRVLFLFIISVLLSTTICFVNSRYRLIAEPVLIVFAASALVYCYDKLTEKRFGRALSVAACAAAAFYALNLNVLSFSDVAAYVQLGNAYAARQDFTDAEEAYRNALAQDPKSPLVHFNLGVVFFEQNKLQESIVEYEQAIELDPMFPQPYNNLAGIYKLQGKMEKAESTYRRAIEVNPLMPQPHYNLGIFCASQNRWAEGIECLEKAIELKPDFIEAHNNIAALYFASGEAGKSISHLEASLKCDPDQEAVRRKLAELRADWRKVPQVTN